MSLKVSLEEVVKIRKRPRDRHRQTVSKRQSRQKEEADRKCQPHKRFLEDNRKEKKKTG